MGSLFRSMAATSALAMFATTAVMISAPTAAAETCYKHVGRIWYEAGAIKAEANAWCRYPELGEILIVPDPANVQRYDAHNGYWYTLASGTGTATYFCTGGTTNTYRLANGYVERQVTAACS
ncbi:MAG TPA: hypothetical protein VGD67_09010 [Pseudonocardiaceae bacterium]